MIKATDERPILKLYKDNYSSYEIISMLNLTISPRQVQRIIKKAGISRSRGDSFRLAVSKGRVKYYTKPEALKVKRKTLSLKTRYAVLTRDNYRCVKCGSTSSDGYRIEVDHIDNNPQNNTMDNLQTLCQPCNYGKSR